MSDLLKDKANLKVHTKVYETYHTDSTLDTASLSSSSLEEGPSGTQTCQLPQPVIISAFFTLSENWGKEMMPTIEMEPYLMYQKHEVWHHLQVSRSHISSQSLSNMWRLWSCGSSSHQQTSLVEGTRICQWVVLLGVHCKVQNGQILPEAVNGWMLRGQNQCLNLWTKSKKTEEG